MMKLLILLLFALPVFAAPVDVTITRPDGKGHDFTFVHHGQSKKALANGPATTVEGELEVLHSDDFANGKSEFHYHVKDAQGQRTAINIDSLPKDIHRAKVRITGKRGTKGTKLYPNMLALDPTNVTVLSLAANGIGSGWTGNVKVLVVPIYYNGNTIAIDQGALQGTADIVRQAYAEMSYGLVNLQFTITPSLFVNYTSAYGSCDMGSTSLAPAALKLLNPAWDITNAGQPGALWQDVVYIMPGGCQGWAGLANVTSCCAYISSPSNFYRKVVTHEMGHTFGNWHAGAGNGLPPSMAGVQEYGDGYGCMGNYWGCGHFTAAEKAYSVGWINTSQTITHTGGSKTYTLDPLEESGGSTYQVLIPTSNASVTYSLEYRKPVGLDAQYPANEGVYIHLIRPFTPDAINGSDDSVLLADRIVGLGQTVALTDGVSVTVSSPGPVSPPIASLLVNGGFENVDTGTPTGSYIYGPTNVTGWQFLDRAGVQKNGSDWHAPSAPDGAYTAFIQLTGSMSQTLNLNAGSYTVRLRAAQRQCCTQPYGNPVSVAMDGVNIGTLNPDPSFQAFGFPVTVGTGSHTLTFTGLVLPSSGRDVATFIDSVTLQ